ncbi:hypothetical protein RQM47_12830 [Rubrivirga sp. S365]|uniref:hypothetical protein n=1 Tax=Rubrivirga sp. S365 TaxID=3076080 RepID=UPI0028C74DEA|nr:hypothetical protein [Rubrivirga sp. S365]MDT7857529.1 hypothetical protein [Rubrivirga sp. S365]
MPPTPLTVLLVLLAALAAPAAAQTALTPCTLYDAGGVAQAGPPLDRPALAERRGGAATVVRTEGGAATFEVTYAGFTPQAQAAFQAAVDVWAEHVASPVPIRIDARFESLGANVLGSAGPQIVPDPPGAPARNTFYPTALANALAGRDLLPGASDIEATFNSDFDRFSFALDGAVPAGQYDFVTVVLHELGHGLGFLSSGRVDDGSGDAECGAGTAGVGCWGYPAALADLPLVFDRSVEDRAGRPFLDPGVYPNPSRALGALLQSGDLYVAAPTVVAVHGGTRPEVWAPEPAQVGSSFSHWDEVAFGAGTPNALMTPRIGTGETYRDPGSITCAFFQDMGWRLGAGCTRLTGGGSVSAAAPPAPPALLAAGPNPFRGATAVRLQVPTAQHVSAVLVDALGRAVRTVHDGAVGAGRTRLRVDAAGLPAGAYWLRVQTEAGATGLPLVHVR